MVVFTSVKGAPGVTTTVCLVGATWPDTRSVFVAECDPSGGDLAARFALPAAGGWPALELASRRAGGPVAVGPYLQRLPGGLEVLTDTRTGTVPSADGALPYLLAEASRRHDRDGDVLVDLGRLTPGVIDGVGWTERSDRVVVVLRGDSPSVIQVRERSTRFRARWGSRVGLVVIGEGQRRSREIEQFVGVPVLATLPWDPASAAAVAGRREHPRRLRRRAPLTSAAATLALRLLEPGTSPMVTGPTGPEVGTEAAGVGPGR